MFLGRENEIKKILDEIIKVNNCQQPLSFVGETGIGKTKLLKDMCEHIEEHIATYLNKKIEITYVYIDLHTIKPLRIYEFLLTLKEALEEKEGFCFPGFELYYKKIIDQINPTIEREKYNGEGLLDVMCDFSDLMCETVGAIKKGKVLLQTIKQIKHNKQLDKLGIYENIDNIKKPEDLIVESINVFMKDIARPEIQEHLDQKPLIIYIDNYEFINHLPLVERESFERFITTLSESEKILSIYTTTEEKECVIRIPELKEVEVKQWLEAEDITNEQMQETIFKITHGIPAYIRQCIKYHAIEKDNLLECKDIKELGYKTTQQNWINHLGGFEAQWPSE